MDTTKLKEAWAKAYLQPAGAGDAHARFQSELAELGYHMSRHDAKVLACRLPYGTEAQQMLAQPTAVRTIRIPLRSK